MQQTLYVFAVLSALGSSAFGLSGTVATLTGGDIIDSHYQGHGHVTIAAGDDFPALNVYGAYSESIDVIGAMVTMTDGIIAGDVCGGYAYLDKADANAVIICGGSVEGNVYGGVSFMNTASDNIVRLVGEDAAFGSLAGKSLTVEGTVMGGNGSSGSSGNTIAIYGREICVGSIGQVQNLNFILTPHMADGDTMLTLTGGNADLSGVRVGVRCSGATKLTEDSTVKLIHMDSGTLQTDAATSYEVGVIRGVTASYAGSVDVSDAQDALVLTIRDETADAAALKSMAEPRTAVAALVNGAADFMAVTGVLQAGVAAKASAREGKRSAAPFLAFGGSRLRFNTGSHVNADGFNAALGIAKSYGATTFGMAGEYGIGDYRSTVGHSRGKGDSELYGGALLADWRGRNGWHAGGTVRLGRTTADYTAVGSLGETHYADHASYQGFLLGGGKEIRVSRECRGTIDFYARYMFNHLNASSTTATTGESLHFSSVDSHRMMVGSRYNYELADRAILYAGAAWMHEFDGDANAVIGGFTAPSPSLEGDSGMVEIGTTFAPMNSERVLLNLNLQGWTGVQRGISGGAGFTIMF